MEKTLDILFGNEETKCSQRSGKRLQKFLKILANVDKYAFFFVK